MKAEYLSKNTCKITLSKDEAAAMPEPSDECSMRSFICDIIEALESDDIRIPEGRLLAEMFLRSDGSCILFITAMLDESDPKTQYYCCDINGTNTLISLCTILAHKNVRCKIYCGSDVEKYRLIFTDPPSYICHICAEYGDFSEITYLFACQTAEYLSELCSYTDP